MSYNTKTSPSGDNGMVSALARAIAGSKGRYVFLVVFLVLLSAQGSFVNDMYTPALPSMCRFFGCSASVSQLGLTLGMLGLGVGQMVLGPVSDKYGRKSPLIIATAVFIVASVVSVFSPTIHVFNICRFFQGVGASAGYFLAKTIPADIYSGRDLAKLMALVGAINGIAPASAPVIGGFLADDWGWKSIFLALAAFALILIVMSLMSKESLAPGRRSKGTILRSFLDYGQLFRAKPFMIHVMLKGTGLGLLFAYISSSPFILQTHFGMSQSNYGILIGVNALFMAAGSLTSLRFKPYKKAALIGSIIAVTGVLITAFVLFFVNNMWAYDAGCVIMLFALGMIFATSNTLAMNEGRAQAGKAAAIIGLAGYIVGATVSPLVGLGNILHSTAVVNIIVAAFVLFFALASYRLPADLESK